MYKYLNYICMYIMNISMYVSIDNAYVCVLQEDSNVGHTGRAMLVFLELWMCKDLYAAFQ